MVSRLAFPALVAPLIAAASATARSEDPSPPSPPALTIRLVRPDVQSDRLIRLFDEARAPHPAAALAGWKRAVRGREPDGLGKTWEAILASINPEMVREWRVLDRATIAFGFGPVDGRVRWSAALPADDGTFAALATALTLTDGGADPPLRGLAVDRLGPPGAPLMTQGPDGLAAAGSRADLESALDRLATGPGPEGPGPSRIQVRLDPTALAIPAAPLSARRAGVALDALGCRSLEAAAAIEGDAFRVSITGTLDDGAGPPSGVVLDPAWLDGLPASGILAASAIAIDPDPSAWARAFEAADRIERADPARAGVAPLRTRIALIARAAGVRIESDLWPHLRGVSGMLRVGPDNRIDGALLALHVDGPDAAARLADRVVPALVAAISRDRMPVPAAGPIRGLGRIEGRPLAVARDGPTARIGWGAGILEASAEALADPSRSVGPAIRSAWGTTRPRRAGAFWPGRLPGLAAGSPAAEALGPAPPVLWWGSDGGAIARDEVQAAGLGAAIRRSLDAIPLDLPASP